MKTLRAEASVATDMLALLTSTRIVFRANDSQRPRELPCNTYFFMYL